MGEEFGEGGKGRMGYLFVIIIAEGGRGYGYSMEFWGGMLLGNRNSEFWEHGNFVCFWLCVVTACGPQPPGGPVYRIRITGKDIPIQNNIPSCVPVGHLEWLKNPVFAGQSTWIHVFGRQVGMSIIIKSSEIRNCVLSRYSLSMALPLTLLVHRVRWSCLLTLI